MTTAMEDFNEKPDSEKFLILSMAMNSVQTQLLEHNRILITGKNGELPLQEKVRNLESFVNSIKYWLRLLVGALLLQTISFGTGVIYAVLRLLPILEKLSAELAKYR